MRGRRSIPLPCTSGDGRAGGRRPPRRIGQRVDPPVDAQARAADDVRVAAGVCRAFAAAVADPGAAVPEGEAPVETRGEGRLQAAVVVADPAVHARADHALGEVVRAVVAGDDRQVGAVAAQVIALAAGLQRGQSVFVQAQPRPCTGTERERARRRLRAAAQYLQALGVAAMTGLPRAGQGGLQGQRQQCRRWPRPVLSRVVYGALRSNFAGCGSSTGTPCASQVPCSHRRSRRRGVACTIRW